MLPLPARSLFPLRAVCLLTALTSLPAASAARAEEKRPNLPKDTIAAVFPESGAVAVGPKKGTFIFLPWSRELPPASRPEKR